MQRELGGIGMAIDPLLPPQMAAKAEEIGAQKAAMGLVQTFALAVLAGAFIALGAVFFTTVTTANTGDDLPYGVGRLLGGLVFCLGLILVVVGGAELFTGNNLIVMAWAGKRVSTGRMLRNWAIVYVGNLAGAIATAALMFAGRQYRFARGAVGENMLAIAAAKTSLDFVQAVCLGILCNALVCLAVWLCYSARSTTDKILSILFPISGFVAAGMEHSVANMYFIPAGLFVKLGAEEQFWERLARSPSDYPTLDWNGFFFGNLLPVTLGNVIGGSIMVGLVYWFVYIFPPRRPGT